MKGILSSSSSSLQATWIPSTTTLKSLVSEAQHCAGTRWATRRNHLRYFGAKEERCIPAKVTKVNKSMLHKSKLKIEFASLNCSAKPLQSVANFREVRLQEAWFLILSLMVCTDNSCNAKLDTNTVQSPPGPSAPHQWHLAHAKKIHNDVLMAVWRLICQRPHCPSFFAN